MDWRERIHSDPKILSGKPVVKGTRLSVDLLAVFAYAAESAHEETGLAL